MLKRQALALLLCSLAFTGSWAEPQSVEYPTTQKVEQ